MQHNNDDIIAIFNRCFLESYNTELILGGDEPVYQPADEDNAHHRVIFARGYFASALHEIAHWCIAGPKRRLLEDYGYWYEPDGRTAQAQAEFEIVEIKPQALEWILAASCGFRFQVSCDNLNGSCEPDRIGFTNKVREQVLQYLEHGIPDRAKQLSESLRAHYGIVPLAPVMFE
ncbi:elongation factor P hydroxylase [Photobacterium sp. ZSDE20]|uniref:Elongation factor P hydroxylase n=1 Tax=Photobacterium pectinilyticum TaxID=2906793 RepID=A0ABT1N5J3_9GAMM|nr:elongation factor P hydroxylase [Photobacterium sp. ZSDE20]MCQ1060013.1 elongation factor P hydroxylase [Photobacterium sp. ZSDE20]MDD1826964.1 elongation factor P hydroxylase [Photobacterium sp. ZSDE20]